jgi:Ion channel
MLSKLLIAWCLMALCVTIHAMGLTAAFRWMKRWAAPVDGRFWPATWMLICTAGWTLLMHLLQIAVWAFFYAWKDGMPDLPSAFYFSAVTYTTTGYGDLVLPEEWRLVGGVEALTGILMCGLSTGLFFAVFAKVFGIGAGGEPECINR